MSFLPGTIGYGVRANVKWRGVVGNCGHGDQSGWGCWGGDCRSGGTEVRNSERKENGCAVMVCTRKNNIKDGACIDNKGNNDREREA